MDAGRSRPPDPGGEASNRGQESSNPHGLPTSGPIQNQPPTSGASSPPGPPLSGIISNPNPPPPATGGSSGLSRQPQTGKQRSAFSAGSRQPGSMARFSTAGLKDSLPRAPRGTNDEMLAHLRQRRDEKDAAARAALTSGDKRMAPESEQSDEGPVNKRPQTAPPANDFPFKDIVALSPARALVWVDFGPDSAKPLIGSLSKLPGIGVKVAVRAGRMGDPSIVLTMSVNKNDITKALSDVENEASRFELVFEPYIRTDDGYRVQYFIYARAQDDEQAVNAIPAAGKEILQVACVDMKVRGFRVSRPYEQKYWKPLVDSDLDTHQAMELTTECFNLLENRDHAPLRFKFWFWAPCVFSEWERTCASLFQQCVKERRPYLHQYGVQKPILDLHKSPTFQQVGDGMYLTGKGTGSGNVLDQSVHHFPAALSFPTADAAMTVYGLCPIRAAQYLKGQSIFLKYQECHVFLMPMTSLAFVKSVMGTGHRPKHEDDPITLLENSFRAFIRVPNAGGIKDDGVMVPGLRFTLEFSNEAYFGEEGEELVREHWPTEKGQQYDGTIISPSDAELLVSGTTFAANLTRPPSAQAPQQSCLQEKLQYLPNKDLLKGRIQALPDLTTQQQELDAVQNVWKDETDFVKTVRDKIWKERLPQPKMVDLMASDDNIFDFKAHVNSLRTGELKWSSDQQKGLRKLTQAPDGISIIQGPPGTGKTSVLVEAVACLLRCNRKVQVISPTNTSVNNVCTRIFERIQHWPELSEKILLRVEVPSAMEMDVLQREESIYGDVIWSNPESNQAMLHLVDQQEQEYNDLASKHRQKKDYPMQTTMGYNIRKLEYHDYIDILKERDPTAPLPKFEEVTNDQYCAEKESRSYEYSKLARQVRQTRGQPSVEVAIQWKKLRLAQIARVLKFASCVLMTPHVAGRIASETGSEADTVVVDEGSQLSVHSAMVPIAANSRTIKGLVLVGDHKQLRPVLTEGNINEWGQNARMSLEELLMAKEYPFTMLKTSYRLHRELCSFPSKEFYDNRLRPDPYADPNHCSRVAAREVSKELGIKRPFGCEYVVVNSVHGLARRAIDGGTSLQNFATANAVTRVLGMLLKKGIPANDITILNLYKGQHAITQTKILAKKNGAAYFERLGGMSTIDASQGKQSSIVLLDLVAAKERQAGSGAMELISSFAQQKNRINVAITRAKHALFVFCHGDSIDATSKVVRGQEQSCLVNLWNDARDRGIIAEDKSPDDHPEAVAQQDPAKAPPKKQVRRK